MKTINSKINFFIMVLLIVVLFASIGQMGCRQEEAEYNTTALTIAFVEDAPPDELVPAQQYSIYIDIANMGGADIAPGAHFYLSGFSPETLQNVKLHVQNANPLVKKTNVQEGGKERLIFATTAQPATLQAAFDIPLRIDACYKYNSAMQTSICIGKSTDVCSIEGEKVSPEQNSPGPIQVTSVTERIEGNTLYVTAVIENKGVGEVYLPNVNCDLLVLKDDVNEKLKRNNVQIVITSETDFKCFLKASEPPYGAVEATLGVLELSGLPGGESAKLNCYKTLTGELTHPSWFNVALSYTYRQTARKTVKILPP